MYDPEKRNEIFHQAFSRYGDGLYFYVLKLTGDEEKAKDIVQECFLRLWKNIATIDTQADLRPLLVTYIKNLLIDDFRKSRKQQQALLSLQHSMEDETIAPEVESRLNIKDRQRQLAQSLSNLPEKRQTIFRLIRQEGLSYHEVAQQLNLSLADVKKQMRLSMQVIRKALHFFLSLGVFLMPILP